MRKNVENELTNFSLDSIGHFLIEKWKREEKFFFWNSACNRFAGGKYFGDGTTNNSFSAETRISVIVKI